MSEPGSSGASAQSSSSDESNVDRINLPVNLMETSQPLLAAKFYTLQVLFEMGKLQNEGIKEEFRRWADKLDLSLVQQSVEIYEQCRKLASNHIPFLRNDLIASGQQRYSNVMETCAQTDSNVSSKKGNEDEQVPVVEADGFLYEDLMEELERQGYSSDQICKQCKSTDVCEIDVTFTSSTVDNMLKLFGLLLNKTLEGKRALVTPSTVGSFVYGLSLFSKVKLIHSCEPNPELTVIQEFVLKKYQLNKMVKVHRGLLPENMECVSDTDIVILADQFSSQPEPDRAMVWQTLKSNMKPGSILVTTQCVTVMLSSVDLNEFNRQWLTSLFHNDEPASEEPPISFYLYKVQ